MISIIPITSAPNQTFNCKIPIDGKNITIYFFARFNEISGYWLITLSDEKGKDYVTNLPVLPAENILEQFSYLAIGSAFILKSEAVKEQWPSGDTLGSDWYLVWSDTDE